MPDELRDLTNKPSVVYNASKTSILFAEDWALLKSWLSYLAGLISTLSTWVTTNFIPYTGATKDVDLGANDLTVDNGTLFVNSLGNTVGIGTLNPRAKLEVYSSNDSRILLANPVNGFAPSYISYYSGLTNSTKRGELKFSTNPNSPYQADLLYITQGYNGVDVDTRFFINGNTGNIGIGTESPTAKLSVVGEINTNNGSVKQTLPIKYVKVSDVKAYSTHGGTFTAGAWRTRDINTEDNDDYGVCSIASNQITLQAGTYIVDVVAPAYQTDRSVVRLYNVTAGAEIMRGTAGRAATTDTTQILDTVKGQFTIATTSVIEIQHRSSATATTYGFGVGNTWGDTDVFTVAQFWKIN